MSNCMLNEGLCFSQQGFGPVGAWILSSGVNPGSAGLELLKAEMYVLVCQTQLHRIERIHGYTAV